MNCIQDSTRFHYSQFALPCIAAFILCKLIYELITFPDDFGAELKIMSNQYHVYFPITEINEEDQFTISGNKTRNWREKMKTQSYPNSTLYRSSGCWTSANFFVTLCYQLSISCESVLLSAPMKITTRNISSRSNASVLSRYISHCGGGNSWAKIINGMCVQNRGNMWLLNLSQPQAHHQTIAEDHHRASWRRAAQEWGSLLHHQVSVLRGTVILYIGPYSWY